MRQEPWLYELDSDWIDRRWRTHLAPIVFADAETHPAPTLLLLGGQPGAGKTRAGVFAAELVPEALTRIVGDDYRQYHPQYEQLLAQASLLMPEVTAQAAGEWTRLTVERCMDQRYPLLIEGTWRNTQVPVGAAREARAHGFTVHCVVLAVNPVLSRLSTVERYYRDIDRGIPARWTPPHAHEESVHGLPASARALGTAPDVDRVTVVDRQGRVLFDATEKGDLTARGQGFAESLELGMAATLTEGEANEWLDRAALLEVMHENHTLDNPEAVQVWTQITGPDTQLVRAQALASRSPQSPAASQSAERLRAALARRQAAAREVEKAQYELRRDDRHSPWSQDLRQGPGQGPKH